MSQKITMSQKIVNAFKEKVISNAKYRFINELFDV